MKTLNELFNSKVKYQMYDRSAEFEIGDTEYKVDWVPLGINSGPDNDWEIAFGSRKAGSNDNWRIYITDDGNEFKVFATVIDIIKKFIKKKKPFGIVFTAKEANRVKLYRTMIKKIGKEWDVSERKTGTSLEFYLTRE